MNEFIGILNFFIFTLPLYVCYIKIYFVDLGAFNKIHLHTFTIPKFLTADENIMKRESHMTTRFPYILQSWETYTKLLLADSLKYIVVIIFTCILSFLNWKFHENASLNSLPLIARSLWLFFSFI